MTADEVWVVCESLASKLPPNTAYQLDPISPCLYTVKQKYVRLAFFVEKSVVDLSDAPQTGPTTNRYDHNTFPIVRYALSFVSENVGNVEKQWNIIDRVDIQLRPAGRRRSETVGAYTNTRERERERESTNRERFYVLSYSMCVCVCMRKIKTGVEYAVDNIAVVRYRGAHGRTGRDRVGT